MFIKKESALALGGEFEEGDELVMYCHDKSDREETSVNFMFVRFDLISIDIS